MGCLSWDLEFRSKRQSKIPFKDTPFLHHTPTTHTHTHTHTHTCTHTRTGTHIHTHTHIHKHTHARTHVHTYTRTHARTRTRTRTHTHPTRARHPQQTPRHAYTLSYRFRIAGFSARINDQQSIRRRTVPAAHRTLFYWSSSAPCWLYL